MLKIKNIEGITIILLTTTLRLSALARNKKKKIPGLYKLVVLSNN
jgi:hypothetical protein